MQERILLASENGESGFVKDNMDVIRFRGRICIPQSSELRMEVLEEAHKSRLSFHPGMTKMY